jgi:hypothetical protein
VSALYTISIFFDLFLEEAPNFSQDRPFYRLRLYITVHENLYSLHVLLLVLLYSYK